MSKKKEYNLANIKSFVQGNIGYFKDKLNILPQFVKEQVYLRIYTCKDTCLAQDSIHGSEGECEKCGCPALRKAYAMQSCNPDKHANIMDYVAWQEYKAKNNIDIDLIMTVVEDIVRNNN